MSLNLIIETGSYVGNGGTQTITIGTGWQPACVLIASTRSSGTPSQRGIAFKTVDMPSNLFLYANPQDVDYDPGLTILSNGFQVTNNEVNHSGTTFYWTAFRAGPAIDTGTYSGQGVGSTTVALGRQPSAIFLGRSTGSPMLFGQKPSTLAGTDAFGYSGSTGNTPQVTITSTGFTTEGDWDVDGETYWWCAVYDLVGSTRHFQSGTYNGTGTLQQVTLGAQPRMLTIYDPPTKWALKPNSPADEYAKLEGGFDWITILGIALNSTGFTVQQPWSENTVPTSVYDFLAGMR